MHSSQFNRATAQTREWVIRPAAQSDRERIYASRHEIYARELGQHPVNAAGRLVDPLDEFNTYLIATLRSELVGYVSVTPPGRGRYSVEKYLARDRLPFPVDDRLYEIRLLTVLPRGRRTFLALALMWAAFRWAEARGGSRIVAIGREDVLGMYARVGMRMVGPRFQAGAVTYHLMQGTMQDVHDSLDNIDGMLRRIESEVQWDVGVPFWTPAPCFHGGGSFQEIGSEFDRLERRAGVINADVLDAWFGPAPKVLEALRQDLAWLVRTSPPSDCGGFLQVLGRARGVPVPALVPGAGSSDLIFRALRHWLRQDSRVLLLDPTYGEYAHVLDKVVGCRIDRWHLPRSASYQWRAAELPGQVRRGNYDWVVLVNPNSPTGQHVTRSEFEAVLKEVPASTRVWIDETYIEYTGADQSLESFAARSENVVICKSMSKVYGLSGLRVAYLCGAPHRLEALRAVTPPWVVGLPAQLAAVRALQDPEYYSQCWNETNLLRGALANDLRALGWDILPGSANFLLCHTPPGLPAARVAARCREHGLWLRQVNPSDSDNSDGPLRIAVKDAPTNLRMVNILRRVMA